MRKAIFRIGLLGIVFCVMLSTFASTASIAAQKAKKQERIFLRLNPGGHIAIIRDLFFFDHGRKLISASEDKTIRIWDVSDLTHPRLIKTIRGEIGRGNFGKVYAIAVDPKGKFLAVGGYLYDHTKELKLATAIRLHDLKTGRVVQVLKGHDEDVINELAFSPDGRYLASPDFDS